MKQAVALTILGLLSLNLVTATKRYDESIGLTAMYYAGAAYCERSSVSSWSCGEACNAESGTLDVVNIVDDSKGTFGYVSYNSNQNQIVVSFRGSQNIQNWFTNLSFDKKQYKDVSGAQAHRGFYEAYEAVSDQVLTAVRSKLSSHSQATILVTGHSLGGALATHAAIDIKTSINPSNTIHFYTFGSPRVGNQQFSDYVIGLFNDGHYSRVTHYDDAVVHQPLTAMGFNHAGNEVWYKNAGTDMTHTECENSVGQPESSQCSDQYLISSGITAHLTYLGHPISNMCNSKDSAEGEESSTTTETELFLQA